MARVHANHPCEGREPLKPWKANHLYIGDDGRVLCGRCMGVESTFRPWCWSDLGPKGADGSITLGPMLVERGPGNVVPMGTMTLRCEIDSYTYPRERE
jgi:hypothetical protein